MTFTITPKTIEKPQPVNEYIPALETIISAGQHNGGSVTLESANAGYQRVKIQRAANALGYTARTTKFEANGDTTVYEFILNKRRAGDPADAEDADAEVADETE